MVLPAEVLAVFDTELVASHSSVCLEQSHSNSKGSKSANVSVFSKRNHSEDPTCLEQGHSSSKGLKVANSLNTSKRDHQEDPDLVARVQLGVAKAVTFAKRSASKPPPQWNCFKELDWDWRPAAVQQLLDELHYEEWVLLLRRPRVAVAPADVTLLDLLKEAKQKHFTGDSDYEPCLCHLRKWLEDAHAEHAMRCVPQPSNRPLSASAKVVPIGPRRDEQQRLEEMRSQEAERRREEADRITHEKLQKNWKERQARCRHILSSKTRARREEVLAKSELRRSQSAIVLRRKSETEEIERQQVTLKLVESEVRAVLARQSKAANVKNRAKAAREENEQWRQIAEEIRRGKAMYEEAQRQAKWRAATEELQSDYVSASDIREEALRERAEECRRKRELREDVSYGLRETMPIIDAIAKAHSQQPQHHQGSEPASRGSSKDRPDRPQSACGSSIKTKGPLPTEQLVEQVRASVGSSWRQNVIGG